MPARSCVARGKLIIAVLLLLGTSASQAQEAPPAGPPYRVGGNVTRPEKISGAPPVYTEAARKARLIGVVIVETVIDEQGNVTQPRVLKGLPMGLEEAAVEAVQTWKFKPATLDGRPVPVYYVLTINFQLDGGPDFGPVFQQFLQNNPELAEHLRAKRYQEAAELLDRRAREEPSDAGIALARSYLFLEQGRLAEAWQEAQAYQGPEPYEILHRIGAAAWQRTRDSKNDAKTRAEAAELGLQAETLALAARDDSFEAVVHKIVLLRAKAKLTSDPDESRALIAEADQLRERALELRDQGKAVGMTFHPAAMEALAGSVDKAFQEMSGGPVTRPEKTSGTLPVEIIDKARKAGLAGVVILEAVIDEQGNVQDVKVVRGLSAKLDKEILRAVQDWEFKPATFNGKPVKVTYTLTVNIR
jgi:TonB family protein